MLLQPASHDGYADPAIGGHNGAQPFQRRVNRQDYAADREHNSQHLRPIRRC
jgi:hypothetical protein